MLGKKTKEKRGAVAAGARSEEASRTSTSVISKEMRIRGDCIVDGRIRIEGRISGDVRAGGLELAESGSVEGDLSAADDTGGTRPFVIAGRVDGSVRATRVDVSSSGAVLQGVEAEEAHVKGRVEGGILARRRLVLEETAVVEGDVRARTLALKEGGQVNGTIVMGDRATLEGSGVASTDDAVRSGADGVEPTPSDASDPSLDAAGASESSDADERDEESAVEGHEPEPAGANRSS